MQLLSKPAIATVGGIGLLAAGVGLGASESIPIGDIRSLHIAMALIFVALAPAIVYIHAKRFYRKGATDWVAKSSASKGRAHGTTMPTSTNSPASACMNA